MISLNETVIQTSNLELAALTFGNPAHPPVVALHGWLDNAASFIPLAKFLDKVHLIALDLPGHGKSGHRSGANAYHFVDYATDVILAVESLGLNHFSLLGHSLGGGVAAVIAAIAPDKVKRLAMVEGLAPVTAPPQDMLKQLRRHVDSTRKPASLSRVYDSIEQAAVVRQQAGDLSLAAAMLIAERNLIESSGGYRWRTDRRLKKPTPVYLVEEQVVQYLSDIQCEAMLIRSNQGILKTWPSLAGREPILKKLDVIDIEGGHHCHMDTPEIVAQYLSPFLTDA